MSPTLPENLSMLLSPNAYPHPVSEIRLIETHMSWVLLTGDFTYKIKRPVRYPFVDMRTLERRRFLCMEELRLNRRFAPDLYVDVCPVTFDGGEARIAGTGEVIDHAVRMRQFSPRDELADLLERGDVAPEELEEFGRSLARIHERLPAVAASLDHGTFESVRASLTENLRQCAGLSARAGLGRTVEALEPSFRTLLDSLSSAIDARRAAGHVRECHGDLHCRNLVRHMNRLVAFDCLEFEPAFRWIDVAEEIAFLFMDLRRRGGNPQAVAFLNGYFAQGGDYEAARLVALYSTHRALVRAKVAALEVPEAEDTNARERAVGTYRGYVECAASFLGNPRPAIILMSGLSGSGKTWLAERLSPRTGGIHIRSDIERKRLAGLSERSSSGSPPGEGIYTDSMNDSTYRRLVDCATDLVAGGFTSIVDATFQRRDDRALFRQLATRLRVPLVSINCHVPDSVARARIVERARQQKDASEADLRVLESQRRQHEPVTSEEALTVLEADTSRPGIVSDIERQLRSHLRQSLAPIV